MLPLAAKLAESGEHYATVGRLISRVQGEFMNNLGIPWASHLDPVFQRRALGFAVHQTHGACGPDDATSRWHSHFWEFIGSSNPDSSTPSHIHDTFLNIARTTTT